MKPITMPDLFVLQAAEGWLILGNPAEAEKTLEELAPVYGNHPEVLEIRWRVLARKEQWDRAVDVAGILVQKCPGRVTGWLLKAHSLRRSSGLLEAWKYLTLARKRFPKNALIHYNLACYLCQLGRNSEARERLQSAFLLGDTAKLKTMAGDDPDLTPILNQKQKSRR